MLMSECHPQEPAYRGTFCAACCATWKRKAEAGTLSPSFLKWWNGISKKPVTFMGFHRAAEIPKKKRKTVPLPREEPGGPALPVGKGRVLATFKAGVGTTIVPVFDPKPAEIPRHIYSYEKFAGVLFAFARGQVRRGVKHTCHWGRKKTDGIPGPWNCCHGLYSIDTLPNATAIKASTPIDVPNPASQDAVEPAR